MVRDWTMPLDEEDRGVLADTRVRFEACLADIAAAERDPFAAASALEQHLAAMSTGFLPPPAQVLWTDRIARVLKSDPAKPLTPRAMSAIRSWPLARIDELTAALTEIHEVLVETENEALHEAIYAEISRAYS
ncbi:MAG: hypothetical protein R3D68_00510 [Hyphomicrobiaceae bacterium]